MLLKKSFTAIAVFCCLHSTAQTCFSISNRTNGNGNPATCGTPNCSGNAKTGHIDVSFGASCPATIPTLQLISVTSGPMPSPFCFDPGNCISPGTVRYCFRGTNLPSAGFMTVRLTQGATAWGCTYDVAGGAGTLLPVKLTGFEAKLQQQQVQLKWQTEQEINNDRFQIERSTDNRTFIPVGTVKGVGTSSAIQHYSFIDTDPAKGVSFYRLNQIDIDDRSAYSSVIRIDNRIKGLQVKQLFPNPVKKDLNLVLNADEPCDLAIRIFNFAGMQVLASHKKLVRGEQRWHITMPDLKAGVYEMIVTNSRGDLLSEKLIVN
jgi:hypothetical protein